MVLTNKI